MREMTLVSTSPNWLRHGGRVPCAPKTNAPDWNFPRGVVVWRGDGQSAPLRS